MIGRKILGEFISTAVLAGSILAAGVSLAAGTDVLYWMVDDSATVWTPDAGTISIEQFASRYESTDSSLAARIRVTGGNIQDGQDVFLDLYYADGTVESGEFGIDFEDNGSGYWGAGVPTGNQSPIGSYSSGSPEYTFIVELGNVVWDDSSQELSWTTVATGASGTYNSLSDYIHTTFDLNPPATAVWTPHAYAVPEPSSGLLVVMGLALLALRRKKSSRGA